MSGDGHFWHKATDLYPMGFSALQKLGHVQIHRVANLAFWSQILKFWPSLVGKAWPCKMTVRAAFQHYKSFLARVYNHAVCELPLLHVDFISKFLYESY